MFRTTNLSLAYIIAFVNIMIGLSLYYIHLADLKTLIILHYESLLGADVLGRKEDVLGILLSGLGLIFLNFLLTAVFYQRRRSYAYAATFISLLLSVLILAGVIAIISVN